MRSFRSGNLVLSLLAMILILAIVATLLGASTVFHNSVWLVVTGLALFLLAGMPALREMLAPSPAHSLNLERRRSGRKISTSLVAVSSAAILAVYAAGYDRTSTAADHLEVLTSIPRRPAAAAPEIAIPTSVAIAAAAPATAAPAPAPVSERTAADVPAAAAFGSSEKTTDEKPTPASLPSSQSLKDEAPTPTSTPEVVEPVAPKAVPAPEPRSADPPAVAAITAQSSPQSPYQDGSYFGWGTCRHGSLQVQVVIQAGKISSAEITQCLTRYSCSVIRNTPSQLVARQNPDAIDNVSGATQSVDAYYFAVKEALKEAAKSVR